MTKFATKPLAWAKDGTPLEVSDEAVAWQVRKLPGEKGGRPAVVYGPDGGPLFLELDAGIQELSQQAGPGRYRLEQVDDELNKVGDDAIVVVQESGPAEHFVSDEMGPMVAALQAQQRMFDGLLTSLQAQQVTIAKAYESQTKELAHVMASSARLLDVHNGQGISELVDALPAKLKDAAMSGEVGEAATSSLMELMNGPLGMMVANLLQSMAAKMNEVPAAKSVGDGTSTG